MRSQLAEPPQAGNQLTSTGANNGKKVPDDWKIQRLICRHGLRQCEEQKRRALVDSATYLQQSEQSEQRHCQQLNSQVGLRNLVLPIALGNGILPRAEIDDCSKRTYQSISLLFARKWIGGLPHFWAIRRPFCWQNFRPGAKRGFAFGSCGVSSAASTFSAPCEH